MQIAKFVGHRPRPPSSSGVLLFPFSFLSHFPFFSRNGIVAGTQVTRIKLQPMRQVRRLFAPMQGAGAGGFFWNSIGVVLPRRWIVRASRDGL